MSLGHFHPNLLFYQEWIYNSHHAGIPLATFWSTLFLRTATLLFYARPHRVWMTAQSFWGLSLCASPTSRCTYSANPISLSESSVSHLTPGCTRNSNTDRLTLFADWHRWVLNGGRYRVCSFSVCLEEFLNSGRQDYQAPEMLPLSPLLLVVFPAALFVAAQGAGDLHGFTFPGGGAGFDPTGTWWMRQRESDWIK